MPTNVFVMRLCVPIRGSRYDSEAGERRTILWRQSVPRDVMLARAGQPLDWGGAMVRAGDYEIVRDERTT